MNATCFIPFMQKCPTQWPTKFQEIFYDFKELYEGKERGY